ncbi:MAG: tRNA preQ1(34) S-adenosylmethionine ribosyltransferase-isomerase QueA [Vicinamibacterales bacterium]|nr:tRNA preQ1(34) S-adenosylmethionine ribosyltransferase-isomerase QueA [Vicinamibacterales bacterium]
MKVSDFDFDLPADLIAQDPPAERGTSRLLALDRSSGRITHHQFGDLPSLLNPGDVIVVNDTRVFPARLVGKRLPGGGSAECFLVKSREAPHKGVPYESGGVRDESGGVRDEETWVALVHPGQRLRTGSRMLFEGGARRLHAEVTGMHFHGRRTVRLWTDDGTPVRDAVDALGRVPLPPYIKRVDAAADRERYQTVYARERGSIAAPTAGLHFTPALLAALAARGIATLSITLHVGYGTFQPIRVDLVEEHEMEPERYEVSADTAAALSAAKRAGRRIIAVGTTSTRTLESLAIDATGEVGPGSGETALFIFPGHPFQLVSGLITNFHLPRSSLVLLVSAFGGTDHVRAAYRDAIAKGYRFYSYGDAMVVL